METNPFKQREETLFEGIVQHSVLNATRLQCP